MSQNAAVSQEEAELETSALVTGRSPDDTKAAMSATGAPVNMKKVFIALTVGLAIGAIMIGGGAPNSATSSNLSGTPPSSTTNSDRAILSKFYDATDGGGWIQKTGWKDADTSVCDWYGVTCNSASEVEILRLRKSLEIPQTSYNILHLQML